LGDELSKIAVSRQEAEIAYRRLKELEETKPTVGELGRGALAGATIGTLGGLVSKAISPGAPITGEGGKVVGRGISGLDELVEGFKGLRGAKLKGAPKIVGKGLLHAGRLIAAPAAASAVFGAGLPIARGYLDREAEKETLEQYIDKSKRGKLRREIKRHMGV
jgi:hypothetical protein